MFFETPEATRDWVAKKKEWPAQPHTHQTDDMGETKGYDRRRDGTVNGDDNVPSMILMVHKIDFKR